MRKEIWLEERELPLFSKEDIVKIFLAVALGFISLFKWQFMLILAMVFFLIYIENYKLVIKEVKR